MVIIRDKCNTVSPLEAGKKLYVKLTYKEKTCKSDHHLNVAVKQSKSRSGRNTPFGQPQITICFY